MFPHFEDVVTEVLVVDGVGAVLVVAVEQTLQLSLRPGKRIFGYVLVGRACGIRVSDSEPIAFVGKPCLRFLLQCLYV